MTLPTTSYAILGLLSLAPDSSPHDVAAFAARSVDHFWSIPRSLVYRELVRLEELGYVAGRDVAQAHAPDKRTYRLTPLGDEALQGWLDEPRYVPDRRKSELLVRVFFGQRTRPDRLAQLLAEYRDATANALARLERTAACLEPVPEAMFPRLTALHGIRAAEARMRWLAEVDDLLDDAGHRQEAPR